MNLTIVQAVRDALFTEMSLDERVVLMGEDVGHNGGVFRATLGLLDRFGGERVIDTPLAEAEKRDPKGLYKKARAGEIKNFTGISSPYEPPETAEIVIDTARMTPEDAASLILAKLEEQGLIPRA